jgi:hypothetical protein
MKNAHVNQQRCNQARECGFIDLEKAPNEIRAIHDQSGRDGGKRSIRAEMLAGA